MTGKTIRYVLVMAIILSICIISGSISFFYSYFKTQVISDEISDWASFGDYFGGVTNTLISFLSLIILGFLTHLVSKQSSEENIKNNILERKMDAYDLLSEHITNINYALVELPKLIEFVNHKKSDDEFYILENKSEIYKCFKIIYSFHNFLFSFEVRFSHLFKYSFKNKDYERIIFLSKKIKNFYEKGRNVLEQGKNSLKINEISGIDSDIKEFFNLLVEFINELREEI